MIFSVYTFISTLLNLYIIVCVIIFSFIKHLKYLDEGNGIFFTQFLLKSFSKISNTCKNLVNALEQNLFSLTDGNLVVDLT